jgi:hypothetical protein
MLRTGFEDSVMVGVMTSFIALMFKWLDTQISAASELENSFDEQDYINYYVRFFILPR